jgi:DNA-binding CsgD family transcriptional regulator
MNGDTLEHYGMPRRSGRYPWGSGEDPYQDNVSFLGYVDQLQKQGMSELEIAEAVGLKNSTELRLKRSVAKNQKRAADSAMALKLKDKGLSNVAIGKRMNINESSVRALLDPALQERGKILINTTDAIKLAVDKKNYVDVGLGVENHLGVSRNVTDSAISALKDQGYQVFYVKTQQLGTGKYTSIKVLAKPGVTYSELYKNREDIKLVSDIVQTSDRGTTYNHIRPPEHISSNRVQINYKDEGGSDMDGVIQLRRGVKDLDLGESQYAQVRIGVDGTHFLKGMAIYSDNMPRGVDVIYNTTKKAGTPKEKVFKELDLDPDNPFSAVIKPGGQKGAINIVNEEGDWEKWSNHLSSQMLSKQPTALAKKQLDMAFDIKNEEFGEISRLTNPVVKKTLLREFSDDADSSAVELQAASLPRQSSHVILPLKGINEKEIYAPNYKNGEKVVLIRHPHGGTFEIPELTVNNKSPEGNRIMKQAKDAVGIHPKVAQKLSGADFDGDTVIVIPNNRREIKSSPSLAALKNFDPKEAYPYYEGMKVMSPHNKQMQMGLVSNLITDMTIKGAPHDEIARAIKHSMVVIDAEKHKLDYERSYLDNNIGQLKERYQGRKNAGASTIVSRSGSEIRVPHRKERIIINPKTGKKEYELSGETYINRKGKLVKKMTKSTRMAEVDNAFELSSGTPMETLYARHANNLKGLANKARLEMLKTSNLIYSPTARQTYAHEVEALKAKLSLAYRNKPLERQALLLANKTYAAKKGANPHLDNDDLKKLRGQELERARSKIGAKKVKVEITDREWEAIQAGAITTNILTKIINNTDTEKLKERSMPRTYRKATPAKVLRAKDLYKAGYTQAEIAEVLGLSVSTIKEAIDS